MLLRKIQSKGRWDYKQIPNFIQRNDALFTGDAIADLRTKSNTISVWHTPDLTDSNIKPILTTMALNCDKIDKVFYVALDEDVLRSKGLMFKQVIGNCDAIIDPNILNRHHDIYEIDYWHLGFLAEYIYELIKRGEVYNKSKTILQGWAKELIATKQADPDKMNNDIRKALGYKPIISPLFSECIACPFIVNP